MFKVKTIDKISSLGLNLFTPSYSVSSEAQNPDAIIVRSSKVVVDNLQQPLSAIGRAGIGVNNIPVNDCTEKGIVVFNTPGANANGVKELVLLGMLLSARDITGGIQYVKSLNGYAENDFDKVVEANKSKFKGFEIKGKHLGVIGLGAIGIMVANDSVALGMQVSGYDPFLSVERAWSLSRNVAPASNLDSMLSKADYLTLHVPLTDSTRGFFNKERMASLKKGVVVLNFARGEIVNEDDILTALNEKIIAKYITDFPTPKLISHENVIAIPHLGASTQESEDNCATMVVDQIKDFLENGNIKNSVNFPECSLERNFENRLLIANVNVPNMLGQIATLLASEGINIVNMVNKSKGNIAYNMVDVSGEISENILNKVKGITGVIMQRVITKKGGL